MHNRLKLTHTLCVKGLATESQIREWNHQNNTSLSTANTVQPLTNGATNGATTESNNRNSTDPPGMMIRIAIRSLSHKCMQTLIWPSHSFVKSNNASAHIAEFIKNSCKFYNIFKPQHKRMIRA